MPDNVTLVRDYDPSLPEMAHDPDQIEQVLLNITRNALQALGEAGGTITLRTRTAFQITLHGTRYRLAARIDVEDDGPGVPAQLQDTLFYRWSAAVRAVPAWDYPSPAILSISIAEKLNSTVGQVIPNSRSTCPFVSEVCYATRDSLDRR